MDDTTTLGLVLNSLGTGLPLLLLHFLTTLVLLGLGIACYMGITPFHERQLVAGGNMAAGIVLGGTVVALAIPLAATLATSLILLDIVVWGLVALALQLITVTVAGLVVRPLPGMIEDGNMAAAASLVGVQLAVALLNAGAMAG